MLKSSLFDYGNASKLVKGTITVPNTTSTGATINNANKVMIFQNRTPFTDCRCEINNTQIDNAKDIDAVLLMYNLIENSDNYSKTSGI